MQPKLQPMAHPAPVTTEPLYLDDGRPDLAGLDPDIVSILLNVAGVTEADDGASDLLALAVTNPFLQESALDVAKVLDDIGDDPESPFREDTMISYGRNGDHWIAKFDGLTVRIPDGIRSACPEGGWANPWTWAHKFFLRLLIGILAAKATDAEPGTRIRIRICKICGRSACPYHGPYAYIEADVW